MQERLATRGIAAADIDALLISHDHRDHVQCMGVYHRKFGLPVYATERTLMAARRRQRLGIIDDIRIFSSGSVLKFGPVTVETVPTPHDGVDGVGFVIDDGRNRLGVLTDLGHVFGGLSDVLSSLDAVLMESNYEPSLLDSGPYPEFLKDRIRGPSGHLSNQETGELLCKAFRSRLRWACLAHLSEQNNDPGVALSTNQAIVGPERKLMVASRYAVSAMFDVCANNEQGGTS
jgi:phosphoribosyl 1,2-cyclic phosphodiesterase